MSQTHEAVADRVRANTDFLARLSWSTQFDYLAYLNLHVPGGGAPCDPTARRVADVADPLTVARYCDSKGLGSWHDREFNARRRCSGGRTYSPRYYTVPDEDITTMMQHMAIEERRHPDADEARDRFAEATRSAAFTLQLGIREIRLLADTPWTKLYRLRPNEIAAFQKLIDRGLVVHEPGKNPTLSQAGQHVRALLVLSRHIVEG